MFKKVILILLVFIILLSLPTLASGSGDESEHHKCPDLVCLLARVIDAAGNRNGGEDISDILAILSD
ncbi:MAG: hypothetical protein H8D34_33450 [Chloroflexi bacterium]|nr:hypothetical protein [Chloroflexota bacterium]